MFDTPNRRGMEALAHFLLSTLDVEQAGTAFKNCWPVLERQQEVLFRKAAAAWIAMLGEADPEARIPKLVPSLMSSPSG